VYSSETSIIYSNSNAVLAYLPTSKLPLEQSVENLLPQMTATPSLLILEEEPFIYEKICFMIRLMTAMHE
jgi:hypothetical protein